MQGPHAEQWRAYYAGVAQQQQQQQAAQQAAAPQPPPAAQPQQPQPSVRSYSAALAVQASVAAPVSYNAVPPPQQAGQWGGPARVPPPQPPPHPPPAQPQRPGIATAYTVAGTAPRPAYVTSAAPPVARPLGAPPDAAPARTGWPPSLRAWVERAFSSCVNDPGTREWIKAPMKSMIDEATARGELWTRDWDRTPLPAKPGASAGPAGPQAGSAMGSGWPALGEQPKPQQPPQYSLSQYTLPGQGAPYGQQQQPAFEWRRPGGDERERKRRRSRSRSSSPSSDGGGGGGAYGRGGRGDGRRTTGGRGDEKGCGRGRGLGGGPDWSQAPPPPLQSAVYGQHDAEDYALISRRGGRFGDGRAEGAMAAGPDGSVTGTQRRRAAVALQLSLASEAEAEPDWDALTIKGTAVGLEKSYFRLTSAPDPSTVRPPEVLAAALERLREGHAAGKFRWLYLNDQCKALRQDCTVQRLRSHLTLRVYEFHARCSLLAGDLAEYNQCATVLATLWEEGEESDARPEFNAYALLYAAVARTRGAAITRALLSAGAAGRADPGVVHALAVREALVDDNWAAFFRLYRAAELPGARALMDAAVESVRFSALRIATRAFRPTLPLEDLVLPLGFDVEAAAEAGAGGELGEASEAAVAAARAWLLAHGCVLVGEAGAEEVDCRASAPLLFVPVDDKAVSHGDQDLAVTDFLKTFGGS